MWLLFAIGSAVIGSFYRFLEKPYTTKLSYFSIGWVMQALMLPVMALLFITAPKPNPLTLPLNFWLPLLIIWLILYPIQTYCFYHSYRHGQLSQVLPMGALTPVFNIGIAWLLLRELPSTLGFISIFTIIAGVLILNYKPRSARAQVSTSLYNPLLLVTAALSMAIGTTLDKVAINASNPIYYTFVNTLGAATILFLISLFIRHKDDTANIRRYLWPLLGIGTLGGLAYTLMLAAIATGLVSYATAVSSAKILIGSMLGVVFLKDDLTPQKILASLVIMAGLVGLGFA